MITTKKDVKSFLEDLRLKIDIFGIAYLRRDKNIQTLLDLDITSSSRTKIIKELEVEDYSEGPLVEKMNAGMICGSLVNKSRVMKFILK